jgi:hypothetical protein
VTTAKTKAKAAAANVRPLLRFIEEFLASRAKMVTLQGFLHTLAQSVEFALTLNTHIGISFLIHGPELLKCPLSRGAAANAAY